MDSVHVSMDVRFQQLHRDVKTVFTLALSQHVVFFFERCALVRSHDKIVERCVRSIE